MPRPSSGGWSRPARAHRVVTFILRGPGWADSCRHPRDSTLAHREAASTPSIVMVQRSSRQPAWPAPPRCPPWRDPRSHKSQGASRLPSRRLEPSPSNVWVRGSAQGSLLLLKQKLGIWYQSSSKKSEAKHPIWTWPQIKTSSSSSSSIQN